ncbi:MAG TPA: FAD-dependent oxidoreductase [Xanthobacteraceae bacterium]|jgi:D-amino-acid dehydrogenase|nr:FAD-dependent oxidoreductase [Xanthobacteraceae bacterium]
MARTDAIVLGAGIVGTATALQLARRGLSVALIDRAAPGAETSYGNAGIIEGNTIFPPAFPARLSTLLRIALKRAPEANYHLTHLPQAAPWLLAFAAASRPQRLIETARVMRPLFARALAEHEELMADAGASSYLRREGWLKLYRTDAAFASARRELELADEFGITARPLDVEGARALEPHLSPVFRHAVHWPGAASVSNPLAVTEAYATRLGKLGGVVLTGDARSLHRVDGRWRIDAVDGPVDAAAVVLALGPFAPDILKPLGIALPLGIKRGYHLHFSAQGNAGLARPVVDLENGYCLAPMQQGMRLTTGAEFAARTAPPTPVQLDRLLPGARALFPLGAPVEAVPWMGCRPCFADSRPVIGRAPRHAGLWLAYGHGHWGLTLSAATGRLLAEMITEATPFCDPTPYGADRFKC